ncbi:hypothetical protein ACL6C3_14180 [Capilliphycus salinus ALCB114379]|uniref:hypothetical protein n=1 Tax=Capilliphycus salinus TaxID=2768948 RepID=UPI0039A4BDBB
MTNGNDSLSYYVGSGDADYAFIADFNIDEDFITISENDFFSNLIPAPLDIFLNDVGGAGIYYQNDLIAFIPGVNSGDLVISFNVFLF